MERPRPGSSGAVPAGERPVQRFNPTSGLFAGYVGLAVAAATVVLVVLGYHTLTGLRLALGAAFFAVVVWMTQLRPRATAYPTVLELRNALRDTWVPYTLIDQVTVGQTLNVWVGERRYVCIGIGGSFRSDLAARRRESREAAHHVRGDRDVTASYRTFVITCIEELVSRERRRYRTSGREPVDHRVSQRLAVPELVALAVTGALFAVSLLL